MPFNTTGIQRILLPAVPLVAPSFQCIVYHGRDWEPVHRLRRSVQDAAVHTADQALAEAVQNGAEHMR